MYEVGPILDPVSQMQTQKQSEFKQLQGWVAWKRYGFPYD